MLYATATFWLLIIVLAAWGVHQLWSGMVKPKVVNTVLLPGTLAAQMGHVLGLLVTGATVNNTTLYKDDDTGAPEQTSQPQPRIPIIGPIIIGLLPLLACAVAIFLAARFLGAAVQPDLTAQEVATVLPATIAGFWQLLREQITLLERTLALASASDLQNWKTWLFIYLVICLTVRMAPFPGNLRGSLGAVLLIGLLALVLGTVTPETRRVVENGWGVLSLAVTTALLLLLFSALVRGLLSLAHMLFKNA